MFQTFDDGSTLSWDAGSNAAYATPATDWAPSAYGSEFAASQANPAASSWADIFKYGIGRAVDYGVAKMQLQNTYATGQLQPYQVYRQPNAIAAGGGDGLIILLIAGALVFALAK